MGKLIVWIGLDVGGIGKCLFNVVVFNVFGFNVFFYFKGVWMWYWLIVVLCIDGMGLIVVVISYDGEICISFMVCCEIVFDLEFLIECIEQSYVDLLVVNVMLFK